MEQLLQDHAEVTCLDHHKTAQEELLGLRGALFDMNRSGAMITWDYFYPGVEAPYLIRYIQDRDLWKFELEDTKAVNKYLSSIDKDFSHWLDLLDDACLEDYVEVGEFLLKLSAKAVEESAKHYKVKVMPKIFGTGKLAIVNTTDYSNISDLGHKLLEIVPEVDIALMWAYSKSKVKVSLRSRNNFDCTYIAKHFGGGGHAQACGFELSMEKFVETFLSTVTWVKELSDL